MTDTIEQLAARPMVRTVTVDDIAVRSDGDGRTVEAFAAMFAPVRAEIRDQDGHYHEENARTSFNKTVGDNGTRFGVFYNHARTIYGTPDGALSVPIGVPVEVDVQDRGVMTVTRYLDNPLADAVLNGIKEGAIRGQSYGGRFVKSTRTRAAKGALPVITRNEIAMREYGPTVFPAYVEAEILGTRSVTSFLDAIDKLDPEDVDRLRQMLGVATPLGPVGTAGTPPGAAPADEPLLPQHSTRHAFNQLRARARKIGALS